MKLQSTFALLDVMRGRGSLNRLCTERAHDIPVHKRPQVIIRGHITGRFGAFDGVSQEFSVEVESVEVVEAAE